MNFLYTIWRKDNNLITEFQLINIISGIAYTYKLLNMYVKHELYFEEYWNNVVIEYCFKFPNPG